MMGRLRVLLVVSLLTIAQWRGGASAFTVGGGSGRRPDVLLPSSSSWQQVASPGRPSSHRGSFATTAPRTTTTVLYEKSTKKAGVGEKLRTKLLAETIAPWRGVRLFFYGAFGASALVGGVITLTGVAAALSGTRTDLDLNTEYQNLAIDFGAVVFFAVLAKLDLDKKVELDERVEEQMVKKKELKAVTKGMRDREKTLGTLQLDIQVSTAGDTKQAAVKELQAGARQHVIVVAGPKKACRDALVGANLLKMDFALSNVLVVPYETDVGSAELASRPSGGFGGDDSRPVYEKQAYVARPSAEDTDAWAEYIRAEMNDAVEQNGEKAREEGIAVVIANTGKVLRRGVGKVPWRQMVEELEKEAKKEQ